MTAPESDRGLKAEGVVELARVTRNGLTESRHLGAAIVLGPDGSVLKSLGDTSSALVYPRSSIKPLQAITVLGLGANLEGVEVALASASHAGTSAHQNAVSGELSKVGLTESDLGCPEDWPLDLQSQAEARLGSGKRKLAMNCSGKHASFLLACRANDWPIDSYLDPGHPLQLRVRQTVENWCEEKVGAVGVDGCGAPLFALSLRGLARGIGKVAAGVDEPSRKLVEAIKRHPWAIDGIGRANTVVVEELGLLCKGGAEGVMVMAAADGTSLALKMIDGSHRATTLVALSLLAQLGVISAADRDRVAALTTEQVLGGGLQVGAVEVSFQ